jgi:hypothetical protein
MLLLQLYRNNRSLLLLAPHAAQVNLKPSIILLNQLLPVRQHVLLKRMNVDLLTHLKNLFRLLSRLSLRQNRVVEECAFSDLVVTVIKTLLQKEHNRFSERLDLEGELGKRRDSCGSDHGLLQVHAVVDEPDVGGWGFGVRAFLRQEIQDFGLDLCLHAVFDVLGQDQEGLFTRGRGNLDDRVDYGLPEQHIWVVLQTISKELQKHICLVGHPLVQKRGAVDGFNLELHGELRQVRVNLFEQLSNLVLIACLE